MSETSGIFVQGTLGAPEVEARGNEALPSTFGEAMSAQFGQAFAENAGTRAARYVWNNMLPGSVYQLQPEELNRRFGVPGRLTFDAPMTEHAARDLQEHHLATARREDAIRRRGDGIGGGTAASILTSLGAGLLDPLNIAAAFIPVGGEAWWSARLGAAVARGVAGRAAVRGAQGAASGFLGGLVTEPVNWALTRYDHDDYTMGNFLANVAVGTVLGGALPAAAGVVRDRYRGLPPWSPEMHDAARTQSIAALVEGRPIQAAQAMDFVAARDAHGELRRWYEAQSRQADEVDNAMRSATHHEDVARAAAPRLAELQLEARRTQLELDDAHARLEDHGIEPATRERIEEIDAELARTVPKKRRADLERERVMLMEGQDWEGQARATGDLESGRTAAEIEGLSAAQQRTQAGINLIEANIERAQRRADAAGTILEQRQAAWAARRDMVRDLAAKTLRGVAWKIGADVDPADINRAAMRIMRAAPREIDDVIRRELKAITDRVQGQMGPFKPGVVLRDVEPTNTSRLTQMMDNLDRNRTRAADDLAGGMDGSRQVEPDADTRLNDAEIARAPKVEGTLDDMLAEVEKANTDIEARLRAEDKSAAADAKRAGREAPEADPALEEAAAIREEGEQMAKAYEAAAVCAMRG